MVVSRGASIQAPVCALTSRAASPSLFPPRWAFYLRRRNECQVLSSAWQAGLSRLTGPPQQRAPDRESMGTHGALFFQPVLFPEGAMIEHSGHSTLMNHWLVKLLPGIPSFVLGLFIRLSLPLLSRATFECFGFFIWHVFNPFLKPTHANIMLTKYSMRPEKCLYS